MCQVLLQSWDLLRGSLRGGCFGEELQLHHPAEPNICERNIFSLQKAFGGTNRNMMKLPSWAKVKKTPWSSSKVSLFWWQNLSQDVTTFLLSFPFLLSPYPYCHCYCHPNCPCLGHSVLLQRDEVLCPSGIATVFQLCHLVPCGGQVCKIITEGERKLNKEK